MDSSCKTRDEALGGNSGAASSCARSRSSQRPAPTAFFFWAFLTARAHSTIFGTTNSPLAWAGALRSASSCARPGSASSGRVTLTIGKA